MVDVTDTGELSGPELPEGVLSDGQSWHPQTQSLWRELRRSPLMRDEPGLTWQFMIDAAILHHRMWQHEEWRHAPELRLRLAKIGVSPEDRQRLRVRVTHRAEVDQTTPPPAGVTALNSRRARLTDST
jgi:hypothetical protein